MSLLPCAEIEPKATATRSVIWLHGLGADGNDFVPIIPQLQLPDNPPVRFVFPHAPARPVTINNGMHMPAWYDILDIAIDRKVDEAQLLASASQIQALIEREIERGIDSHHIVLAGFSQGGAVAYEAALSYDRPLAGLMALSTYFATADSVALNPANQSIPILIQHGVNDPIVPEALGQQAQTRLQALGYRPQYETYPMAHEVCMPQILRISQWLQSVL